MAKNVLETFIDVLQRVKGIFERYIYRTSFPQLLTSLEQLVQKFVILCNICNNIVMS